MLDPREADEIPGELDPALRGEIAHTTAAAIVHRARASEDPEVVERLVRLVEDEGLDVVAAQQGKTGTGQFGGGFKVQPAVLLAQCDVVLDLEIKGSRGAPATARLRPWSCRSRVSSSFAD